MDQEKENILELADRYNISRVGLQHSDLEVSPFMASAMHLTILSAGTHKSERSVGIGG